MRLLRPRAEKQNVQLKVEWSDENVNLIQANSARLEQVFLNLGINAIAAMSGGGTLRFLISGENGGVRIDVTDTGPNGTTFTVHLH